MCVCVYGRQDPGGSGGLSGRVGAGEGSQLWTGLNSEVNILFPGTSPRSGLRGPCFWGAEIDLPGHGPPGLSDDGGWGVGGKQMSQNPIPIGLGSQALSQGGLRGVHRGEKESSPSLDPPYLHPYSHLHQSLC